MQKKVLLPLVLTVPAVSALADVSLKAPVTGEWKAMSGISQDFTQDKENNEVTASQANGLIVQEVKGLPYGKYKLDIASKNNCKIVVTGTNVENFNAVDLSFEISGTSVNGNSITITVSSEDEINDFSFMGMVLTLVEDYANEVASARGGIKTPSETFQDNVAAAVKEAIEKQYNLAAELASLNTKLDALAGVPGQSTADPCTISDLVKYYEEVLAAYGPMPDGMNGLIDAYNKLVDAYDAAVKQANADADQIDANTTYKSGLTGGFDNITSALNAFQDEVKATDPTTYEYAIDNANSAIESFNADFEAYKKAVNDYDPSDLTAPKPIDQEQALLDEIEDMKTKFASDKTAVDNLNALKLQAEQLSFYYNQLIYGDGNTGDDHQIDGVYNFKGIVYGQSDDKLYVDLSGIYDVIRSSWMSELATIFDTCNDTNLVKVLADAATTPEGYDGDKYTETKDILDKARQDMEDKYADIESFVVDQNNAAREGLNKVKGYEGRIEAATLPEGTPIPTGLLNAEPAGYEEVLADANAAVDGKQKSPVSLRIVVLNAYKNVDEAYANEAERMNGSNFVATYSEADNNAEVKVKVLEDLTAAWMPIIDLQKALEEAKETMKDYNVEGLGFNALDKFDPTINNIQTAIDKLTPDSPQADFDAVQKLIDNLKVDSKNLYDIFNDTYNNMLAYQNGVKAFEGSAKKKLIVLGKPVTVDGTTKTYNTFDWKTWENGKIESLVNDAAAFVAAMQNAAAVANPQDCYDEAVRVAGTFNYTTLNSALEADRLQFAKDATQANEDAAQAYLADAQNVKDQGLALNPAVPGFDKIDFDPIKDALDAIQTTITGATSYVKLNDEDKKIKAEVDKIQPLLDDLAVLQTSYDNYFELVGKAKGQYNYYTEVQKAIDLAIAENEKSFGGGKAHFAAIIEAIQKAFDEDKTDLDALFNGADMTANPAKPGVTDEVKSDYKSKFDSLIEQARNAANDIAANNAAMDYLQGVSANVRDEIQKYQDIINDLDHQIPEVDEWIAELQKLVDEDLLAADTNTNNAYGEGNCAKNKEELKKAYDDILAQAKQILDNSDAEYGDLVKAVNDAYVNTIWPAINESVTNAYLHAIGIYNGYVYDLSNKGYKEFVQPTLEAFKNLYDYSNNIIELGQIKDELLKSWNEVKAILPKSTFDAEVKNVAAGLKAEIEDQESQLVGDMAANAVMYYDILTTEIDGAIADATTAFTNAGFTADQIENALASVNSKYKEGKTAYSVAVDSQETLGQDMDNVANILDKVIPLIDLQKACENQWAENYAAACEAIYELLARAKACDLVEYDPAKFTEAKEAIADLNAEVSKIKSGLIDSFKDYNDQLQAIIDALTSYVEDLEAENADATAEKAIKESLIAEVGNAKSALDKFIKYTFGEKGNGGFTAAYELIGTADALQTAYTALENAVDPSQIRGTWSKNQARIEALIASFNTQLANAYKELANEEIGLLRTWCVNVMDQYNNAAEVDEDVIPMFNEKINPAIEAVDDLAEANVRNPLASADTDFHSKAEELMTTLTTIYVDLYNRQGDDAHGADISLAEVIDGLNGQYDVVADAIADVQIYLVRCHQTVQNQYKANIEELQSVLDAVKALYEAQGDNVVASAPNYEDMMARIQAQVSELETAVKNAEELAQAEDARIAASDAQAGVLQDQLDELKEWRNQIQALAEGYGTFRNVEPLLNEFDNEYEEAQEWLDSEKADHNLTEDSEFANYDTMNDYLGGAEMAAERVKMQLEKNATYDLLNEVTEALADQHIVDRDLLWQQYSDQRNAYNDVNALTPHDTKKYDAENSKTLRAMISKYQGIQEALAALLDQIKANTFVPGNVDLDENGEVNAIDVQMVISWIGESTLNGHEIYEERYALNPVQASAADVVDDDDINIADVTAIIDLSLGKELAETRMYARSKTTQMGDAISMVYVGEVNGHDRYALVLNNGTSFIGGQFDIKLPSNCSLVEISGTDRTSNHEVMVYEHSGSARVMIVSLENATIIDNDGAIAFIDVDGKAPELSEAIFSDSKSRAHVLKTSGTTITDMIIDAASKAKDMIFDAAGRAYDKLQRGINIIRKGDGTTTKTIRNK